MVKEPCNLLIDKIREHGTITKCPYCGQLFDIHVGMLFLEGKETEDYRRWGHKYFEEVMQARPGKMKKDAKVSPARTIMDNETIKRLIMQRAEEVKDEALIMGWKFGGEKECDNCEYEYAWILTSKAGFDEILCRNCGYDTLGLDWSDLTKPLPWPPK